MTKSQLSIFEDGLKRELAKIAPGPALQHPEIHVDRRPNLADQISDDVSREIEIANLERDAKKASAISSALRRIVAKTYGDCSDCGEEISLRRLMALPWAALCIRCQEAEDSKRKAGFDLKVDVATA